MLYIIFVEQRYEQISKKAVKLGSFFKCSVHMFLASGSVMVVASEKLI